MDTFDLDTPVMHFDTPGGEVPWTIRSAVEGVQIFGGIGSGKTSGSGRFLALKYLKNGFGGLVLTVKPDERALWEKYCKASGRSEDLVIIEPGGQYHFNFLEYESSYQPKGLSLTTNLVQVIKTVIQAGNEQANGSSDNRFWEESLDILINNVLDLSILAYGKASLQKMYDIVVSAPKKESGNVSDRENSTDAHEDTPRPKATKNAFEKAIESAEERMNVLADEWFSRLPEERRLKLSADPELYEETLLENFVTARTLRSVDQYFIETFRHLHQQTRSIIELMFSGFLSSLLRDPVYTLFGRYPSNVTPEDALKGKIILIDLPVKIFHKVGRDTQLLFKYIFQRSMERRNIDENARPVFIWADEAQHFLHEHDSQFQATARSSRIATVYLTQNLHGYFNSMGGEKSMHRVKGFLGTLSTKFFHSNGDPDTNRYAVELFGKGWAKDFTHSTNFDANKGPTTGQSFRFNLEENVRPEDFGYLKTGGPLNNYLVEAYIHRVGEILPNGLNHMKVAFNQNIQI